MRANCAADYIEQLSSYGEELELHAEVLSILGEGDTVAALVDYQGPMGSIL
jgi:hypothetical protein